MKKNIIYISLLCLVLGSPSPLYSTEDNNNKKFNIFKRFVRTNSSKNVRSKPNNKPKQDKKKRGSLSNLISNKTDKVRELTNLFGSLQQKGPIDTFKDLSNTTTITSSIFNQIAKESLQLESITNDMTEEEQTKAQERNRQKIKTNMEDTRDTLKKAKDKFDTLTTKADTTLTKLDDAVKKASGDITQLTIEMRNTAPLLKFTMGTLVAYCISDIIYKMGSLCAPSLKAKTKKRGKGVKIVKDR